MDDYNWTMHRAEKIAGLIGSACIFLLLTYLGVWRFSSETAPIPSVTASQPVARVLAPPTVVRIAPATQSAMMIATATAPEEAVLLIAPAAATPVPIVHIIRSGENLYRIALLYDVPLPVLAAANHIADTGQIVAGQALTIPLTPPPNIQPTFSPSPTLPPAQETPVTPLSVNGLTLQDFVIISDPVRENLRRIFLRGRTLGNNSRAFSSVGDSTIEYPYFMAGFDHPGRYKLGNYETLQAAIDYFSGSFDRQSMGVMRGLRASTALDPFWSDKTVCGANESRIACEYRLNKPSIVFIRLGSNEGQPKSFDKYLRQIVDYWLAKGVIPIMGTKADRVEGSDNADNQVIRQIAADYAIPLWDFDRVALTVAGGVVGHDGIHLTSFASYDFTAPEAFQRGYGLHNITALIALNAVWTALTPVDRGDR